MELSISSFSYGSFVVSIVSKKIFSEDKLFFNNIDSEQKKSILDLINLIKCNYDEGMLKKLLDKSKIKVIEKYRKFLTELEKSKSDINFTLASPNSDDKHNASLLNIDIPKIIEKLDFMEYEHQPTFDITGILVALDVDNKKFAMRSDGNPFEFEDGATRKKFLAIC